MCKGEHISDPIAQLKILFLRAAGFTQEQIAEKFDVSQASVSRQLNLLRELSKNDQLLEYFKVLIPDKQFAEIFVKHLQLIGVDHLLLIKRRFQKRVYGEDFKSKSFEEKLQILQQLLMGINEEGIELLEAIGAWKPHRFSSAESKRSGVLEECVDIVSYCFAILELFDISSEEFYEFFIKKAKVVDERFTWEYELKNLPAANKNCAIDLDGVLCLYPENWIQFINEKRGLTAEPIKLEDFKFTDAPLPHIPRKKYYEWKHEFREQGFESLHVKPMPEAAEFTKKLKELGYKIIILSSRPHKEYKRIMVDTIEWLHENDIKYDAVYWHPEKHIFILKDVPFINFMVEDDPHAANAVASLGYKLFLLSRPYNKDAYINENIVRINNLLEIIPHLRGGE